MRAMTTAAIIIAVIVSIMQTGTIIGVIIAHEYIQIIKVLKAFRIVEIIK